MSAKKEHMKAVAARQVEAFFKQDYPIEIYEEMLREKLESMEWADDDIEGIVNMFRKLADTASVDTDWNELES